tara:strand:- start:52 stop:273 length:222 start_codon:yes stop_codon:yes gene_type:complete
MSKTTVIDTESKDAEEETDVHRELWKRIKFLEAKVDTIEIMTRELIQAHGRTLKEFTRMIEVMAGSVEESPLE